MHPEGMPEGGIQMPLAGMPEQGDNFIMMKFDRITTNPEIMNGQPCLRNCRITVRRALEIAALYPDRAERLREYPEIDDEDIRQALHFAATQLPDGVYPLELDALVA